MNLDVGQVDAIFAALVTSGQAPGVAYGVVADGELVHRAGAGVTHVGRDEEPDENSVFRIASVTKSFTASAVLRLRDAGALNLDDAVSTYLPEVAAAGLPTADSPALTIRHLLTMSAGLPTDDAWADRQESMTEDAFSALLRSGIGFTSAPGTAFEYSNLGFAMLGRVITEVAGREYRDEVREALLAPLGMSQTCFSHLQVEAAQLTCGYRRAADGWVPQPFDRPGVFSAIGGLYSSVADLARWVGGFTQAFPARDDADDHPVSRATRRDMQQQHRSIASTPVLGVAGGRAWPAPRGYGYGLFVEDDATGPVVSHPGGYPGYGAHVRWSSTLGIGVIALANATYAPVHQPAAQALAALIADRRRPGPTPWSATRRAAADVQQLIEHWDDELADTVLAPNVDLDLPRRERRDQLTMDLEAVGHSGSSESGDTMVMTHDTAAAASWTVEGSSGRVRVDIWLTPEVPPRVQTVAVTAAVNPSEQLDVVTRDLVEGLSADPPHWATHLTCQPDVDPDALVRQVIVARAVDGPLVATGERLGAAVPHTATYVLATTTALWHLILAVEPDSGRVTEAALTPAGLRREARRATEVVPREPQAPAPR